MKVNEELLAKENIGLVSFVLKKMKLNNNFDDYYDVGLVGLTHAVKNFDPEKGYKFNTFAVDCIKKEVLKQIQKENALKRKEEKTKYSLDKEYKKNFTLKEFVPLDFDLQETVLKNEQLEDLYLKMDNLKERERIVLYLKYGFFGDRQFTFAEIGKILKISSARAGQIHATSLKKLKKMFSKERIL